MFEYLIRTLGAVCVEEDRPKNLQVQLNGYGKDGWELVSLIPQGIYPCRTFLAIFKQLTDEEEPKP